MERLAQRILARWAGESVKGFVLDARAVLNAVQGNGVWCVFIGVLIFITCLFLLIALLGLWTSNVGITNEDIIRIYLACAELYLDPAWNIGVRTYGADKIRGTKYVPHGKAIHTHMYTRHSYYKGNMHGETNEDRAKVQKAPATNIYTSQESEKLSAGTWSPIIFAN